MATLTAPVIEKTVVVQPNGTNIIRPGQGVSGAIPQPLGRRRFSIQQLGSTNLENLPQGSTYPRIPPQEGTQFLTQKIVETWVKKEPRKHGTLQIVIGLLHVSFGSIMAALTGPYYISITTLGGYPFWGGLSFVVSGALSVAAEKKHTIQLVRSCLGMAVASAVISFAGIILLLIDLILNSAYFKSEDLRLGAGEGISAMLLLATVVEFLITISAMYVGLQAKSCHHDPAMAFVPYNINTGLGDPSTAVGPPPPYGSIFPAHDSNVDTPKIQTE